MPNIELYDYQSRAIAITRSRLSHVDSVALIAGCGAGKTIIASEICRLISIRKQKVLIIVPYISLLSQFAESLISIGFNENEIGINTFDSSTVVAIFMAQTIESRGVNWDYSFVIWDEAHLSYFRRKTQQSLKNKYKEILFTATPWRADGGKLPCELIQVISTRELIKSGKNSEYRYHHLSPDYDLVMGEKELTLNEERNYLSAIAPKEQILSLPIFDRKTIFFFSKKAIAREYCDYFHHATGKTILLISDTTPMGQMDRSVYDFDYEHVNGQVDWDGTRSHAFKLFREGKVLLATVTCLAIGFDEKCVDCIVMLRSFSKQGFTLFTQIIGRGLRSHPDKSHCDIYGCGSYFPLPDEYDDWNSPIIPKSQSGVTCQCGAINGNGYHNCYKCGRELPRVIKSDFQQDIEHAIQLFLSESLKQFPSTHKERSRRYNQAQKWTTRDRISDKSPQAVYQIYLRLAVACGMKLGWAFIQFRKLYPDVKPSWNWRRHAIFGDNPTKENVEYFRKYLKFTGGKDADLVMEFGGKLASLS